MKSSELSYRYIACAAFAPERLSSVFLAANPWGIRCCVHWGQPDTSQPVHTPDMGTGIQHNHARGGVFM
jgi:hypothetical protein